MLTVINSWISLLSFIFHLSNHNTTLLNYLLCVTEWSALYWFQSSSAFEQNYLVFPKFWDGYLYSYYEDSQVRHREFKGQSQVSLDISTRSTLELGSSDTKCYILYIMPLVNLCFLSDSGIIDPNLHQLMPKVIIIVQAISAISHLWFFLKNQVHIHAQSHLILKLTTT